jgi:hypothetical protein
MKKYFIVFMMLLVIGFNVDASAQRHRHHQNVSINVNKDSSSVGITAYSDTTAEDSADVDTAQTYSYRNNVDDFQNTPKGFFQALANAGFTGGAIAFFVSLLCIIAILSPVLLIAVVLYFIFRNRNQKYKLVEKAMAQGKTIPQELLTVDKQSFEYLWAKGIRNASIGLGLVCLFWILGAEEIIGVGLLVFFMGVGQAIIAKTTRKRGEEKSDDSNTQKPFDDSQFSADNGDDKIKDSDSIND